MDGDSALICLQATRREGAAAAAGAVFGAFLPLWGWEGGGKGGGVASG